MVYGFKLFNLEITEVAENMFQICPEIQNVPTVFSNEKFLNIDDKIE